jgi:hypothetical protein
MLAMIVTLWMAVGCVLALQGIHILRSGDREFFFLRSEKARCTTPELSLYSRLASASMYLVPALAMTGLLAAGLYRTGFTVFLKWTEGRFGGLAAGIFLFVVGLLAVFRPWMVIMWVKAAHPDFQIEGKTGSYLVFVRLLAAFIVAFGLFLLAQL